MPKRKSQRKSNGKKIKKLKERPSEENSEELQKNGLSRQISEAAAGLFYISETDAEIMAFTGKEATDTNQETVLIQTGNALDSPVEEKSFTEFFDRLTKIQDWHGDEEKETVQKFSQLRELLEKNLRDLKVYKIGKIQLDVYVVGLNAENKLLGFKTKAVET